MKSTTCVLLLALLSGVLSAQRTFELGVAYRYVKYTEAEVSLTHIETDQIQPHEVDFNLRVPMHKKLFATLNIGFSRYDYLTTDQDNILLWTCDTPYHAVGVDEEYYAYRFNPGIEYSAPKGKITWHVGAGIYYYGAFGGRREVIDTKSYFHQDSISGNCIEDSLRMSSVITKQLSIPVALIGLSGHARISYEAATGIIFYAGISVNPVYSTVTKYVAMSPGLTAGVNFRLHLKPKENPK